MRIKDGVRLRGVSPVMAIAHVTVVMVFVANGWDCVLTSCTDGRHSPGSFHHCGEALDYRTHHLTEKQKDWLVRELRAALGPQFDVVMEETHLHIEHDDR